MECNLQMMSPELGLSGDVSDAKYVSKLSTILVATIQEAKDRISQIEYVFCDQLYPNVILSHQSFQKIYSEAREAAESGYKEKEKDLLLQIKNLEYEKQQVVDENHLLKSEKVKLVSMEKQSCNHVQELQQELKQKNIEVNEARRVIQNLQKALESKSSFIRDCEKEMKELGAKNYTLMKMQEKLEVETGDLQLELQKKSKEVDEQIESKSNLLQLNQSNAALIARKDVQLKEYEEETQGLKSKLRNMENKVNELLSVIREKTEETCKGKELQENLLKKIAFQSEEITNNEQLLSKYEKDNKLVAAEVGSLRNWGDKLEKGLRNKPTEPQEKEKLQQQLFQQSDPFHSERIKRVSAVDEFEEERKQLLDKQKSLQEKIEELQHCLSERAKESSLLIEAKDSELQSEKRKIRESLAAYKRLKSQYNYLLKKYGHTEETMLSMPPENMENGSETVIHKQSPSTSHGESSAPLGSDPIAMMEHYMKKAVQEEKLRSCKSSKDEMPPHATLQAPKKEHHMGDYIPQEELKKFMASCNEAVAQTISKEHAKKAKIQADVGHRLLSNWREDIENRTSKVPGIISDVTPMDQGESLEDKKRVVSVQRSSLSPSSSRVLSAPKCTSITKPCPSVGAKRPLSYWRDTRSHQSCVGPDPHDDFLDTPLENARENLGKIMKEELPEQAPTNMIVDNSDDEETQDMNADAGPQKLCKLPSKAGTSGFKYVEPVRKKSERDNLKGVECKQCRKFYDAVLPGTTNDKKNIRCEHHDGVSRHRYKYAPPMTPEGFWNIGFESEM